MVFSVGGGAFVVAGIVGGLFGVFYFDLRGRIMLGDAGAAILGSVMGVLILLHGPGIFWWFSLVAIIGLTLVAEFFSFSRIIEEVAFLRRFDAWGRRVNER
jgi:UDP-N-acetylmuramyl pentapeptide phosphotransferase/UDP-N-acetylglucosamine-1-phosphate transferase